MLDLDIEIIVDQLKKLNLIKRKLGCLSWINLIGDCYGYVIGIFIQWYSIWTE